MSPNEAKSLYLKIKKSGAFGKGTLFCDYYMGIYGITQNYSLQVYLKVMYAPDVIWKDH